MEVTRILKLTSPTGQRFRLEVWAGVPIQVFDRPGWMITVEILKELPGGGAIDKVTWEQTV